MEDNLNFKIANALGKNRKHHQSNVDYSPRSPLVFSRPGRRGYFSFNALNPVNQFEQFEVWDQGRYLGRMSYDTIVQKFGR